VVIGPKLALIVCGLALALGLLGYFAWPGRRRAAPPPAELVQEAPPPDPDPTAVALAPPPPAWQEPYFPFLDDEAADASVSIGDTTHGYVVNARPLPEGATYAILPKQRERDLAYGTSELIGLVQRVAAELHARTGTRLWVGNIGRRGGGNIVYSVSHNAGRDADLALAYVDRAGRPVDPPDLVPLDATGVSRATGYRIDAARTWLIVKALLSDPEAQVQYIFLSDPLKQKILKYARDHGEPAAIQLRASAVLWQPGGTLSHNDHLHVRLYCSRRDVEAGCSNFGPVHPWINLHDDARQERARAVAARLEDAHPDQRRRAVQRLVLLSGRAHGAAIAAHLDDDTREVRQAAATGLGALGDATHIPALIARFAPERELSVRVAILDALSDLGGAAAGAFLKQVITQPPDITAPERIAETEADRERIQLAAIDAAGRSETLEPVEALLPLLSRAEASIRGPAAAALRLLTNRSFGDRWDDPALPVAERDRAAAAWRRAVEALRRSDRDGWLATGFLSHGYRVPRIDVQHTWEIIRAIVGPDHSSFNAQRALMRFAEHEPPSASWSKTDACQYWLRWFNGRRRQHRLERPPPATLASCP
jgi:murein endopeptidase